MATVRATISDSEKNFWAGPAKQWPEEYHEERGGRGLYFLDPSGYAMEIFTAPKEV